MRALSVTLALAGMLLCACPKDDDTAPPEGDTDTDGDTDADTDVDADADADADTDLPPDIELSLESHDFGVVGIGCEEEQELLVSNAGGGVLTLQSFSFNTGSADMSLDEVPDENGADAGLVDLEAGDSTTLLVRYAPLDEYDDVAYLSLESTDPMQDIAQITFEGAGLPGPEITDATDQVQPPQESFPLSSEDPVPETIVVRIDDVTTTAGWSYDSGRNAVVFEPAFVPEAGCTVAITYLERGEC